MGDKQVEPCKFLDSLEKEKWEGLVLECLSGVQEALGSDWAPHR